MSVKVSVIVPVYNVEKYLEKCLDSLVNQTLEKLEIIVVNDGSPDNSEEIAKAFVAEYPEKVIYVKKENGGLGDARNYGLDYASGKYIAFLDSDDYVETDTYQLMYNEAEKNNSDLVVCDLIYEYPEESIVHKGVNAVGDDIRKNLFLSPLFAWNKLYRKDFFTGSYKFPVGVWYEDMPVTVPMFSQAANIAYVDKPLMHYVQREGSIMASGYNRKMYDIFRVLNYIYDYYRDNDLLEDYHDELEYLFIEHLLFYGAFRFLRTEKYRDLMKESRKCMKLFPKWRSNRYLKELSFKNRVFIATNNSLTYPVYKKYISYRDRTK